jgi:hypothetical protein
MLLEVELEVPWIHHDPGNDTHAQVSLFAYLTGPDDHVFAILVNAYWNRGVVTHPEIRFDTVNLFISAGFDPNNSIMSMNPVNNQYVLAPVPAGSTSATWKGKRLFRAYISHEKVADFLAQMGMPGQPQDFRVHEIGMLHEMACTSSQRISSAVHGSNLRMSSVRYR